MATHDLGQLEKSLDAMYAALGDLTATSKSREEALTGTLEAAREVGAKTAAVG